jgi:hypothetical protein
MRPAVACKAYSRNGKGGIYRVNKKEEEIDDLGEEQGRFSDSKRSA